MKIFKWKGKEELDALAVAAEEVEARKVRYLEECTWKKEHVSEKQIMEFVLALSSHLSSVKTVGVYGIPGNGAALAKLIVKSILIDIPLLVRPIRGCLIIDAVAHTGKTLEPFIKKGYLTAVMYRYYGCAVEPSFWLHDKVDKRIVFPWEIGREETPKFKAAYEKVNSSIKREEPREPFFSSDARLAELFYIVKGLQVEKAQRLAEKPDDPASAKVIETLQHNIDDYTVLYNALYEKLYGSTQVQNDTEAANATTSAEDTTVAANKKKKKS